MWDICGQDRIATELGSSLQPIQEGEFFEVEGQISTWKVEERGMKWQRGAEEGNIVIEEVLICSQTDLGSSLGITAYHLRNKGAA